MCRLFLISFFVFWSLNISAQDSFWEEDFGSSPGCGIFDADGFATTNGPWTIEAVGPNGVAAHNWFVGPREAGMELGQCGNSCLSDPGLEDNTLYISSEALNTSNGAVFQNNPDTETHLRAASPIVSFIGVSDSMAVKLKYIYSGHPSSSCVFEYFNGTVWTDLWTVEETIGACGDAGEWSEMIIALPSDVSNNPNVRFGFRWQNTGPDVMPAPELSFALDKIECSCASILESEEDYSNALDTNQDPNPMISWTYDDCFTSYTETHFLSPWAAELFNVPSGTVVIGCTAGTNDGCELEAVLLEAELPGCFQTIELVIEPAESYISGPFMDVGWADFYFMNYEVCAGGCLDFTFYHGFFISFGTPEYIIDLPPGATLQNMELDPWGESVYGQVCFEFPGTYELSGYGLFCGATSETGYSGEITVNPTDIVPEITVSGNEICADGCVTFNLEDTPGANVQWVFEGGSPSTANSQFSGSICYDTPGTYGVTVSTSSVDGCGYGEIEDAVTVIDCGDPPVAAFSVPSTTVCAGECIQFTDESTGTNNDTWNWVFAGGTPGMSSEQNPTVCYDIPGIYPVAFTVGNLAGSDLLFDPGYIEVIECPAPSAAFSASTTEICIGECIDFTDASTGTGITEWSWTFDGAITGNSNQQNPTGVCYDTPGTYSVTLSVSNPNGSDEVTESIMIVVDPCFPDPVPDFSVDEDTICPGECVSFTNQSTVTGDTEWSWSFIGAETTASSDESPENICYTEPGNYSVTLTVTDAGGTESLTQNNLITVEECPEPNALFSVSESVICPGECVQLNNLSTGIITGYIWTFPGGVAGDSIATNPELCFSEPGSYSISLTAYNDDDETSEYTLEQAVVVDPCLPEISVEVSADRICVGDCVSFNNVSEESSSNWQWTFAGAVNQTSQQENPAQVCYHTPGVFDVTLQADFGFVTMDSTFSQMIHVIDSCGPVAGFNYTPIICLGQCYDFVNTSTGGFDFFWIFEGAENSISEQEHPAEICYLNETGLFNVTLTVTNEFGSSTSITQQITVVNPPAVNAGPDQTIIQGTSTNLSAVAGNGTGNYTWQPFEDVVCFSCPSTPTYPLQETTTFVVYYEQSGGCQTSDTLTVFIEESFAFGVPGSFSPNGDGTNDLLYVRGSNITYIDFMIYNRYGQAVFHTNNQKEGWDGTYNGRELNAGVFGYSLEVHQTDGTRKILKGDVNLVR